MKRGGARESQRFAADTTDDDEQDGETDKEDNTTTPQQQQEKRVASLRTRTVSTLAMIGGFVSIIYMGHVPLMLLVLTLQFLMVKELFRLARVAQQDRNLPGFRLQQWYFFAVAAFYLYLRFIRDNLLTEISASKAMAAFGWLLKRHTLISYSLYMAGFVSFVLSLRRRSYLYQFGQYAWTHMILMVIFVPSTFFVSNIFEGLIWFLLPSALIITNDIMAYLAGFFFGRTPLIKLSPKKTWEGFIGGFIGTVAAAALLADILSHFKWMTCPRLDLSMGPLDCTPSPIFSPATYSLQDVADVLPAPALELCRQAALQLPVAWVAWLNAAQVVMKPIHIHAMILAAFASLVAPFGGFFASGFKRAFKMKDFGTTIPGHGGVTDRFDCQMIMAMFAYLYYWNYVATPELSVGQALEVALKLEQPQQLELWARLGNMLLSDGLLAPQLEGSLQAAMRASEAAAGGHQR